MNPLRIQQYGKNKNLFTVFTKKEDKFVGWLEKKDGAWFVTPSNKWKPFAFTSRAFAVRYLISSIKK